MRFRWLNAALLSRRSSRNVIWNALGGVCTGVLSTLATPWYVARLGLDAYGVVGLWTMMQMMTGLLDLGMGATLVKGFADGSEKTGNRVRVDLLRTLEYVYWPLAAVPTMALALGAPWIAHHWLHSPSLSPEYLTTCMRIMAIAVGFQFPCSLYASGLAGLQDQGRMNKLQIGANVLRYGGGAAILAWRADLVWFFTVQAIVSAVQTLATRSAVWLQVREPRHRPAFQEQVLRRVWRFSAGMALTASSGVLLANLDRIVLSKMSSTVEVGKYALAFTGAGLMQMGILPFYRAHFPRYSELVTSGDAAELRAEYFRSCRIMAAVLVPIGIAGYTFAPQLFRAWVGNEDPTTVATFRWLLVGIGTSGLMWLPAAFQQAHGWTRLHALMILGALLFGGALMVPAIALFGTVGATTAWVLHGLSNITLGLWLMHRRLLKGAARFWLRSVLAPPLATSLAIALVGHFLMPRDLGRWMGLVWAAVTGAALLAASFIVALRSPVASAEAPVVQP